VRGKKSSLAAQERKRPPSVGGKVFSTDGKVLLSGEEEADSLRRYRREAFDIDNPKQGGFRRENGLLKKRRTALFALRGRDLLGESRLEAAERRAFKGDAILL